MLVVVGVVLRSMFPASCCVRPSCDQHLGSRSTQVNLSFGMVGMVAVLLLLGLC